MLFQILVYFVCVCVLWYMFTVWRRRSKEPPLYPGALPLIGHAHMLYGDTTHLWQTYVGLSNGMNKNDTSIVTMRLGPNTVYLLNDPDDCLMIANSQLQKDAVYDFAKSWIGDGLVSAEVPTWKRHRKMINPAFNQQVLDGFLDVFNLKSRVLVKELDELAGTGPFDHFPYVERLALDAICMTAMGCRDGEENLLRRYAHEAQSILHIYVKRFINVWMHNQYVYNWTQLKREEDRVIKSLHDMSSLVVERRKLEMKNKNNSGTRFKAFIEILLELAEEGALTEKDVREEVDTVIGAGFGTTDSTLMCIFILLGSHPEVQERVYKEVMEVFDGSERDIEKQDLSKLVYLEAVIKETLRIYPVVPTVARRLVTDVKLKNHTLYAGNTCCLFLNAMHRHKVWGPDPEAFKPERWLDPATLPENPSAFGAFSIGRRNCIGRQYAIMLMKTCVAHTLRRYRITADVTKLVLKADVVLKPVSGHHITIEKRV